MGFLLLLLLHFFLSFPFSSISFLSLESQHVYLHFRFQWVQLLVLGLAVEQVLLAWVLSFLSSFSFYPFCLLISFH